MTRPIPVELTCVCVASVYAFDFVYSVYRPTASSPPPPPPPPVCPHRVLCLEL